MGAVETFLEWVKESNNIVFLVEQEYQQKAVYLIFEVWMDFITKSMTILQRQY